MQASFMAEHGLHLFGKGWPIVPIMPGKKAPGTMTPRGWAPMKGWRNANPSEATVKRWVRWPGSGIGIRCGVGEYPIAAVDIDVLHPAAADEIDALAVRMLGEAPLRIGLAPKKLRAYRLAAATKTVKTGVFGFAEDGHSHKGHAVEVLVNSQFVAFAIHPDTGQPYHWPESSILDISPADLAAVTPDQLAEFLAAAEAVLERHGGQRRKGLREIGGERHSRPQEELRARDSEALRQALAAIPNDDLHYDDWVYMGMAIKGALGDEGFDAWQEFSARSDKDDPEATQRVWESLAPQQIGAGTVFYLARKFGWRAVPAPQSCEPSFSVPSLTADEAFATLTAQLEPIFREVVPRHMAARHRALARHALGPIGMAADEFGIIGPDDEEDEDLTDIFGDAA